jgi:hypothetical protein
VKFCSEKRLPKNDFRKGVDFWLLKNMEGKRFNILIYFWLCSTCFKMCRFFKRKNWNIFWRYFSKLQRCENFVPYVLKKAAKNESENESIFLSPFWLLTKNDRKKIKHPYIFLAAYLNSYTEMWLCLPKKKFNIYKKNWSVFTSFGDCFFSKNHWICD